MYIVGKTGTGKSVLLENLLIADLRAGYGLAVIDPHGDLAERILDFVPSRRINDCIYFNPDDLDNPIAFNVLESVPSAQQSLVASGLVAAFKKIWSSGPASSWGPRLEYILRNTLLALLERPGSTLLQVMRMLNEQSFREQVISSVKDPVVRYFWDREFAQYPQRFLVEVVAPIQNKVGAFLSSPLLRNIVGQAKSSFSLREVLDQGRILIVNLAKGRIGEDISALLGALLVTKLQLAAMERVETPEDKRRDFFLYVDEFQSIATSSFADLLTEARKYHLNLILANQFTEQLDRAVRAAVLGNAGTLIAFRVGARDAYLLGRELEPEVTMAHLLKLARFQIALRLMIRNQTSPTFTARTLPPKGPEQHEGNRETIIRVSRERYARKRAAVEKSIAQEMSNSRA
jgi:DNA helicase HerA-like ATPase